MWNTFSVCLSRSAENATKVISLALHSISHFLKIYIYINNRNFLNKENLIFVFAQEKAEHSDKNSAILQLVIVDYWPVVERLDYSKFL